MISNCLQPIRLIASSRASSKNNVTNSGNPSQRLPWQHLLTIFITVFSTAHVPSIHNGYSWFYAVQVTLTAVELVRLWAQTAV